MKIRSCFSISLVFFAMEGSCQAVSIVLDPLSSETDVHGAWHQRRLGSDSGIWFLPGGVLLEIGLTREGNLPDPGDISDGRWAGVSGQFTRISASVGGYSDGLFFNWADNLGDDSQFLVKFGSDNMVHTFSFEGVYFAATDEWSGSFRSTVSLGIHVPDGGSSLLLFGAAVAGIHGVRMCFA